MPLAVGPRQPGQSSEAASARPDASKAIANVAHAPLRAGTLVSTHVFPDAGVEISLDAARNE